MPHESMQTCIDACNACASASDHCASSCLAEKDVQAMARCICIDIDCAEVCRVSAALMSRGSELVSIQCEACAQICEACAAECERHDMQHCRECAQACRRCAEECRRMAQAQPSTGRPSSLGIPAH